MSVIVVTGGSSGIGLATVLRLAGAGHRVFCLSRDPSRADLPEGVTPLPADLADPGAAPAAVATVLDQAGRLDVLVNNAGTVGLHPLEEAGDAEAHRIFEVNLFGPMRLAIAALAPMRVQGGGRIVNVTSGNDVAPAPFGGWYSASKAALASASVVLDAEVHGWGIFVTVVAPGLYRTGMLPRLTDFDARPDSPYAALLAGLHTANAAALDAAGDPDQVARAIEDCIAADDPPARILVGSDVEEMAAQAARSSPDELARMLRGYVAGLAQSPAGAEG